MIKFRKMQGAGNDFILINESEIECDNYNLLAEKICNRHYGVGADGMIIISESSSSDIKMKFYNSDGSEASMCGNGIRCFSRFVYESGMVDSKEFSVQTLGGIMQVKVESQGKDVRVEVNMGKPIYISEEIPKSISGGNFIDKEISIENNVYNVSSLVIGTIHTVLFVDDYEDIDMETIGRKIENNNIFPMKTNVNFCRVIDKNNIEVITWEKGVGITLACGTGAAASAVISSMIKSCDKKINVRLRGGNIQIKQINEEVYMSGNAEYICEGKYIY